MVQDTAYLFGPYRLYPGRRVLMLEDGAVGLGSRAFDLLVCLVERAGEVVTAEALLQAVWPHSVVDPSSVRVHISSLRKSLSAGDCGQFIRNVPMRGYCFAAPVRRLEVNDPTLPEPGMAAAPVELPVAPAQTQPEAAAPVAPSAPLAAAEPARVPPAPQLLGRERLIPDVVYRLERWRCVTLTGPGGVGKSSLALVCARRLADEHPRLQLKWLNMGAESALTCLQSLLASLPTVSRDTPEPPVVRGGTPMDLDGRVLLLLDNCERLVEPLARLIEDALAARPELLVLVTSREPLRIVGETVAMVPPLAVPDSAHASVETGGLLNPAVQLFLARARERSDRFETRARDLPLVAEICRRLDGLPLAIELAAACSPLLTVRQIAEHLVDPLGLLVQGRRTAPAHQQTLRASLDWSFALLAPLEQELLLRLSELQDWFTLDQACTLIAASRRRQGQAEMSLAVLAECLQGLVLKSVAMAEPSEDRMRYRWSEVMRVYAVERRLQLEAQQESTRGVRRMTLVQGSGVRRGDQSLPA